MEDRSNKGATLREASWSGCYPFECILPPVLACPYGRCALSLSWKLLTFAPSLLRKRSAEQLNWQPRLGAWSVGQCLEHLYNANQVYLPAISAALKGRQEVV
ncbi:MAG: DinB family protein, partial [Bryobacteraceae bacterium]